MSEPVAGKFLLEILTKGMYFNPMHIYREYIQNATDAIDAAVQAGLIHMTQAVIHITVNAGKRSIVIRDNGTGIPGDAAMTRLLNIGASDKDGIAERGFRGIGRLAGLEYADEVQFITSTVGEATKTIMICNCVRMQELLQKSNTETADVMETFRAISRFETQPEEADEHYFEVRLYGVAEDSGLLDEDSVKKYLAETAPVDFDGQKFIQAGKVRDFFEKNGHPITSYTILWGTRKLPIHKLYSRYLTTGKQERTKSKDGVRDVEFIYETTKDGTPLFIGWIAVTDFSGTISDEAVQGIRFRKGNILVGDNTTFARFFPTTGQEGQRANRMFAGEIHVLHPGITPNSQRDDFEAGPAYTEMKGLLEKWAGQINQKYRRGTSQATAALKELERINNEQKMLEEQVSSGAVTSDERREQLTEQLESISRRRDSAKKKVERALERGTFDEERKETVAKALFQTETATKKTHSLRTKIVDSEYGTKGDLDSSYNRDERKLYQRIIAIIDTFFADDPDTAKALRERLRAELKVKVKKK